MNKAFAEVTGPALNRGGGYGRRYRLYSPKPRQSNCLWTLISTAALITIVLCLKNCMRKLYAKIVCENKGRGNGGCGLLSSSQTSWDLSTEVGHFSEVVNTFVLW